MAAAASATTRAGLATRPLLLLSLLVATASAQPCASGSYSPTGDPPCTSCPANTYSALTGSTACGDCQGYGQSSSGSSNCGCTGGYGQMMGSASDMTGPETSQRSFYTALSADGQVALVGAYDGKIARAYRWGGSSWVRMGSDADMVTNVNQVAHVSLSGNGSVALVGWSGQQLTRAYKYSGSSWVQMGSDMSGVAKGNTVSISADGTVALVGGGDRATAYKWTGSSWSLLGGVSDMVTTTSSQAVVSLSADGNVALVGDPYTSSRIARAYRYNGASWVRLGTEADMKDANKNQWGTSVKISADGTVAAVGATDSFGFTRIYKYNSNSNSWVQMGSDITRAFSIGMSIGLSADATIAALSAWTDYTYVYKYNGASWTQIGDGIPSGLAGSVSISADGSVILTGDWSYNVARAYTCSPPAPVNGACGANYWLNSASNQCVRCTGGSVSPPGSTQASNCVCPAGKYFDTSAQQCTLCPSGSTGNTALPSWAQGYGGYDLSTSCHCPANQYMDLATKSCNPCMSGAGSSAKGSVGAAACKCTGSASYANPQSTACLACPAQSLVPAAVQQADGGAKKITDCVCAAGSFLYNSTATSGSCQPCGLGNFCPGANARQSCATTFPADKEACEGVYGTSTRFSALAGDCKCLGAVCQNGIRELQEECDDGNSFDGDGCSQSCKIEDPNATKWLCSTPSKALSTCCKSLTNPVTLQKTCSCAGQASPNAGYTILANCEKQDVDECTLGGTGLCHPNAVCKNLDGTLEQGTHTCVCPPGMSGDGVGRCDVFRYQTSFSVGGAASAITSLSTGGANKTDAEKFLDLLYQWGVIPASVPRSQVTVEFKQMRREELSSAALSAAAASLRLLGRGRRNAAGTDRRQQAGSEAVVVIESGSATQMQNTTSSISVSSLPSTLVLVSQPVSDVLPVDEAFGAVSTVVAGGFTIDSVSFNDATYQWVINARYQYDVPDTITALYMPRVNSVAPPYSAQATNSFFVSQHPCVLSSSVCCLNDFKSTYTIGAFANTITTAIGACDLDKQQQETLGMFDPAQNTYLIDHALDEFPSSAVDVPQAGKVTVRIAEDDMRFNFTMREALTALPSQPSIGATGYKLTTFVGMAYHTLLPANGISTTSTQVKVEMFVTDSLSFSFATQQDYTIIKYITLSVFQNKWVDSLLVTRKMQYAKVGVVLPVGMRQNMNTGLIPLGSVRFAIATSLPDVADEASWNNPCFSKTGTTGMWDPSQPWRDLYSAAAAQTCASQHKLCTNPATALLSSNLVEFYFPIGDDTISDALLQGTQRYYIFVYFDVSVTDAYSKTTVARLFVQGSLSELSVSRACESISAAASLLDTTIIDLAVGLVGNEQDWATSVTEFQDITQSSDSGVLKDTTQTLRSLTLQSALVTLVVKGDPVIFSSPLTSRYYLEVEHLVTMHFMDPAKFEAVRSMMTQGVAYQLFKDPVTAKVGIEMSQAVTDLCSASSATYSCVVRHDIVQGAIRNQYGVHSFATGLGTTDTVSTRDWIAQNLLGTTDFGRELAANMTGLVRSRYAIDDRIKKAYYINPGHKWVAPQGSTYQSLLKLSDKMIALAAVVLMDGQGNQVRRRLLSTVVEGNPAAPSAARRELLQAGAAPSTASVQLVPYEQKLAESLAVLADAPRTGTLPPLDFAVDIPQTLTEILGIPPDKPRGALDITLHARFSAKTSVAQITETVASRINKNFAHFCPTCDVAYTTSVNLRKVPAPAAAGNRRLLQQQAAGDTVDYQGTASVVLSFNKQDSNVVAVSEIFRALYDTSYSATWDPALQSDVPLQQFINTMQDQQIVVETANRAWSSSPDTTFVYRDIFSPNPGANGDLGAIWQAEISGGATETTTTTPSPTPTTAATPSPPSGNSITPPPPPPQVSLDEFKLLTRRSSAHAAARPVLLALALLALLAAAVPAVQG